jgi:hypothetical protein
LLGGQTILKKGATYHARGATTSTRGATTSTKGATTSTRGATTSTKGATTSTKGATTSTRGATYLARGETIFCPSTTFCFWFLTDNRLIYCYFLFYDHNLKNFHIMSNKDWMPKSHEGMSDAKKVEFTYTPTVGSCLAGKTYKVVIILTKS